MESEPLLKQHNEKSTNGHKTEGTFEIQTPEGGTQSPSSNYVAPFGLKLYLIFMMAGLGPSWALNNSLYLELPWFEDTQPEGLKLGTWFGVPQCVGTVIILTMTIDGRCFKRQSVIAIFASVLAVLLNIFTGVLWSRTVKGTSAFLLLAMFGSSIVGNLQFVTLIPWVSANFHPSAVNAFIGGNSLSSMISVLVQLIQSPGDARRFDPMIYFIILSVFTAMSLPAVLYIRAMINKREAEMSTNMGDTEMGESEEIIHEYDEILEVLQDGDDGFGMTVEKPRTGNSPFSRAKLREFFAPPWWSEVAPHAFINIWVSMITWWVLNAILPFASKNTDFREGGMGENVLMWAQTLGVGGVLLGTQLSGLVPNDANFHLRSITAIMTLICLVIILASAGIPQDKWRSSAGGGVLIGCSLLIRVLFGYLIPLLFRDIGRKGSHVEAGGRFTAIWTQIVSLFVLLGMVVLVEFGVFEPAGPPVELPNYDK